MNYILLIKQVPDIKHIPDEAWDWEKGTLKRGLLDNVCNELDKQALAFVLELRKNRDGKIVSLTMGPTFADTVLRYTMAAGADAGVLLTDRKLSGADTAATAYPLAQAIRKIQAEIFNGDRNYIIVSGMQSVDGDTAQVPPQIAEDLEIPHVAYATSFQYKNDFLLVQRITRTGIEVVTPSVYPCMITVTNWTLPPNVTFARTRWANAQKLYQWGAADINAADSRIGLAGSRTNVFKIFSPREVSDRKCEFENDLGKLVQKIKTAYLNKTKTAGQKAETSFYDLPKGKSPSYQGEVWVYAEQEAGEINPAALELLGKATDLAAQLSVKVGAILIGKGNSLKLISSLINGGADKVYNIEHDRLERFLPVPYTRIVSELINKYKPQMMLFSATPLGRELAPRIAYRSGSGLTADCTGLEIFDYKKGNQELFAILKQTRPALGGNIMASIISQNSSVQMSTVRPGVMRALTPDAKRSGEIVQYEPEIVESDFFVKILSTEASMVTSELKDAEVIVSGGAGCKTKESFISCIPNLAESLGKFLGLKAMVGASRVAVEMGFIDRSHQVGQTGQTVKPQLYVAVGISGAVQHLTGMQNSDIIVAINKDSAAPIFKVADFGIVGNLEEVVPELIKALESGKS